jgi:hypothetical protein
MKNISCPPASRLASELRLDDKTAVELRNLIKAGYSKPRGEHWSHAASEWMDRVAKLGDFHGAGSLYPDFPEIMYCNAGDAYAATLIFNHATGQVRLGCIGDIVERRKPSPAPY